MKRLYLMLWAVSLCTTPYISAVLSPNHIEFLNQLGDNFGKLIHELREDIKISETKISQNYLDQYQDLTRNLNGYCFAEPQENHKETQEEYNQLQQKMSALEKQILEERISTYVHLINKYSSKLHETVKQPIEAKLQHISNNKSSNKSVKTQSDIQEILTLAHTVLTEIDTLLLDFYWVFRDQDSCFDSANLLQIQIMLEAVSNKAKNTHLKANLDRFEQLMNQSTKNPEMIAIISDIRSLLTLAGNKEYLSCLKNELSLCQKELSYELMAIISDIQNLLPLVDDEECLSCLKNELSLCQKELSHLQRHTCNQA